MYPGHYVTVATGSREQEGTSAPVLELELRGSALGTFGSESASRVVQAAVTFTAGVANVRRKQKEGCKVHVRGKGKRAPNAS